MDMPTGAPGVKDPNHTAWDVVNNTPYESDSISSLGGKSKINKTDMSGPSGMNGYNGGEIVNNMKVATGTTLPVAQPIPIMTYGDPGNTAASEPNK